MAKGAAAAANVSSAVGRVKIRAMAQKAAVTPPIGPTLAQAGLKAMDFVKRFNEETKKYNSGTPLNVVIDINADKTYRTLIKSPDTTWFLKRAIGVPRFEPFRNGKTEFNGTISMRQIYEIAKIKAEDPHRAHISLHAICKQVLSIARHHKLKVIE